VPNVRTQSPLRSPASSTVADSTSATDAVSARRITKARLTSTRTTIRSPSRSYVASGPLRLADRQMKTSSGTTTAKKRTDDTATFYPTATLAA